MLVYSGRRRRQRSHYMIRGCLRIQMTQLSWSHLLTEHFVHHLVRLIRIASRGLQYVLLLSIHDPVPLSTLEDRLATLHYSLISLLLLLLLLRVLYHFISSILTLALLLLVAFLLFFLYSSLQVNSSSPGLLTPCSEASSCGSYWSKKWQGESNIDLDVATLRKSLPFV